MARSGTPRPPAAAAAGAGRSSGRSARPRRPRRGGGASPRRVGRRAIGAALALAGGFGCGDPEGSGADPRPIRGCEGFSYRACDILREDCQRELFGLVACVRGDLEAADPPPVRVLDPQSARALVASESGVAGMTDEPTMMADPSLGERAFRSQVRALELLGMLAPGQIQDEGDVIDANLARLVAYYLVPRQEIVIIDRGAPVSGVEANLVLAHEFVHAQQDRRHGLATFAAELEVDSDAVLAVASLIEGEASLYQYLLDFAYAGFDLDWVDYSAFFAELVSAGTQATLAAGSPALTASVIFPYTFGTRYAGSLWLEGGSAGIDARYADPPLGSWDVLAFGAPPPASVRRPFDTDPVALEGYGFVVDDVAGAWVTAAVLPGLGEPSRGRSALPALASRWRGDHLWIFAAEGEAPAVAVSWVIDWADTEAAALFATLGAELDVEGAVLDIETRGTSSRVVAVERAEELQAWRQRLDAAVP